MPSSSLPCLILTFEPFDHRAEETGRQRQGRCFASFTSCFFKPPYHAIFIWLSCLVVYTIQFQEISGAMALELGESLLENMLGLNTSTDSDEEIVHMGDCQTSSLGDEFFHSKSEYGVRSGKCC